LRLVDSNVFLHAILTPRRKLNEEEKKTKESSKKIVERIEKGEKVSMTAVHLSEVVNIIESGIGLRKSLGFLAWAITTENIQIYPTTKENYETSLSTASENGVSINDAIAYTSMMEHNIAEIYSFDKHFDQLADIKRVKT
jgi:predicted nucleic acid-binding protein